MVPRLAFVISVVLLCRACCRADGATAAENPPAGVRIEICEDGIPADGGFPAAARATETYFEDAFGLFELPHNYIGTGVRADRAMPSLIRASARVALPAGKHRLLLRARGATRLLLDGRTVLETPFDQLRQFPRANGGELPVEDQDRLQDPGFGGRFAPPGNRDAVGEFDFPGTPVTVVLETLVGSREPKSKRAFRPELGETAVAVLLEGAGEWVLLSPERRVVYSDAGWHAYAAERRERLAALNAAARAARRDAHGAYWAKRRELARQHLAATEEVPVPELPAGYPEFNAIDRFIGARIAEVAAQAGPAAARTGIDFHREIKPILEANCYSCHQGKKVKGGLRLDLREAALGGGEIDGPAIVPHRPEASSILRRITAADPEEVMPAKGDRLPDRDVALLTRWIAAGAPWPELDVATFALTPLSDDPAFLRRVYLDTVGVVPAEAEIAAFLGDRRPDRRARLIDRLLGDPRWADHQMGYWMDVLAENPNLIAPTLNNTGPFRWWLYESFADNKPFDLMVTELIRLQGSERFGGPAGFSVASQNDVPLAAKGVILASAFLGVEMKCARCHDAPTHEAKQKDLFQLAAMLERKPLAVPATSSVPLDHLQAGGRTPMIRITLQPGESVAPGWPFAEFCDEQTAASVAETPDDSRDRLAALITAPQNARFAEVVVNRVWQRLMGRGLVETVGDWERATPSHPGLLRWLAREFVRRDYDLKALARLILNSHAYQRAIDRTLAAASPLFTGPAPRRMAAEQLVDSLFSATGKPFVLEPLNIDLDGIRAADSALDLGVATRAWMVPSVSNERDRPSMILPRVQAVAEVMEVFGWRSTRPDGSSGIREAEANVLQPALLSNGTMMVWLTRLSDDHGLTRLALEAPTPGALADRVFLRLLTRPPTPEERAQFVRELAPGFAQRIVAAPPAETNAPAPRRKYVSWANHMTSEANRLRLEEEAEARRGAPPTARLEPDWRERFEDMLWALLNAPEWTHIL